MNPLAAAILIALPFNASRDEAFAAIDVIAKQFDLDLSTVQGVNPASLPTSGAENPDPPVPMPTDPTPPPSTSVASVELDSTGLPWDERIHAKNKAKNADGSWRKARGVDDATYLKIAASLKQTAAAPAAPVATTPAPPAPAPVAPPPSPAAPPAPPAPPVDAAYASFVEFVAANSFDAATNPTGRLTPDYLSSVLTHYGIADGSLQSLAHRPDLVPTIHAWLAQAIAA